MFVGNEIRSDKPTTKGVECITFTSCINLVSDRFFNDFHNQQKIICDEKQYDLPVQLFRDFLHGMGGHSFTYNINTNTFVRLDLLPFSDVKFGEKRYPLYKDDSILPFQRNIAGHLSIQFEPEMHENFQAQKKCMQGSLIFIAICPRLRTALFCKLMFCQSINK